MRMTNRPGVTARAKRALGVAAVAGAAGLSLTPGLAFAGDEVAMATADADAGTEVSSVDVYGQRADKPSSTKATSAPIDTPQTITIVSDRTIRDQNLLTLRDILTTVPGITFGAGEGGGGYGDSINLRGYSANNDITTDGLRDSAQYSRTDPFNVQQIEVINGSNSVYAGAGSVGGSINLVSKAPRPTDRVQISAAVGGEGYGRLTVDANRLVADGVAVRVNLMAHGNDAPGRDVERYERWGVAPAITFGVDGDTRFTLAAFYQEDENTPQYGVPYASNAYLTGPLPGVKPSNYYGYSNLDTQEITVSTLTGRFEHRFSEGLKITSVARWLKVDQLSIVDAPQGTWCLANGHNANGGAACATPGRFSFVASGPRGNVRDTENTQLVSQTDLNFKFAIGGLSHNLIVGFSFASETYDLDTGNLLRNANATAATLPTMSIADPDHVYTGPVNYFRNTLSSGELANQALYLFDTVELGDHWQLTGGVRFEHNEGEFISSAYTYPAGPTPTIAPATVAKSEETLFSYRLGVVFKPVENASIYLAFGNTQTPSQATVNGGCSVTTNPNCDVDPEEGRVTEVGVKWDVLDGRLSLTGALFENERSKYRVNSPLAGVEQQLDGKSRVRGLTLGAAGQIREGWTVIANYTFLDSEILQNAADGAVDLQKGDPIPNTPEHSFNFWTTWMLTDTVMVGYGATYSGEYAFQRPTASTRLFHAPSYWVHNASVTWNATESLSLQLNVKNLFDEDYYTRIRSSNGFGWATPGDVRSAQLTLNYRF